MKYYHFDALGSTRRLSGASGAFTDSYSCTTWGHSIHYSGSTQQPYQYVGQLGYYTHYQDPWLPLLQLGVRFYDPGLGRFTQRDEIRQDNSRYQYANDRPTYSVDPNGLFSGEKYCRVKYRLCIGAKHAATNTRYAACMMKCAYIRHIGDRPTEPIEPPKETGNPAADAANWNKWECENRNRTYLNPGLNELFKCPLDEIRDECERHCRQSRENGLINGNLDCMDALCKCKGSFGF